MKKEFHFGVILLIVSVLSFPFTGFSQNGSVFMREGDALWEERAEVEKARAAMSSYKKVLEVEENSYEACWKVARACFYLGDLLPETGEMRGQHREMGEEGMRYAKRALELNPDGVEGHYYYVLSIAQYSIGISIIKIHSFESTPHIRKESFSPYKYVHRACRQFQPLPVNIPSVQNQIFPVI